MIVVMARVPLAGRAKTRLIPSLGADGAASLAEAMADDVLATVARSGLPWRVVVDGPLDHPWTLALGAPSAPQPDTDLGGRLAEALREGGIAIGTDAPLLPVDLLLAAARSTAEVALAPAADGGYVLVRVSAEAVARGIFTGVPWSVPETGRAQLARAHVLGLTVEVLPAGFDVDVPADLVTLRAALAVAPADIAPACRRWFAGRPTLSLP